MNYDKDKRDLHLIPDSWKYISNFEIRSDGKLAICLSGLQFLATEIAATLFW
jgi:hypothetical protein